MKDLQDVCEEILKREDGAFASLGVKRKYYKEGYLNPNLMEKFASRVEVSEMQLFEITRMKPSFRETMIKEVVARPIREVGAYYTEKMLEMMKSDVAMEHKHKFSMTDFEPFTDVWVDSGYLMQSMDCYNWRDIVMAFGNMGITIHDTTLRRKKVSEDGHYSFERIFSDKLVATHKDALVMFYDNAGRINRKVEEFQDCGLCVRGIKEPNNAYSVTCELTAFLSIEDNNLIKGFVYD